MPLGQLTLLRLPFTSRYLTMFHLACTMSVSYVTYCCRSDCPTSLGTLDTNTTCSSSLTPYSNEATTSTKHRREFTIILMGIMTPN